MFNLLLISNIYRDLLTINKDWTLNVPAKSTKSWNTIAAGRAPLLIVLEIKITYDVYVQYVIDIKPWSRFIDDLIELDKIAAGKLHFLLFCQDTEQSWSTD